LAQSERDASANRETERLSKIDPNVMTVESLMVHKGFKSSPKLPAIVQDIFSVASKSPFFMENYNKLSLDEAMKRLQSTDLNVSNELDSLGKLAGKGSGEIPLVLLVNGCKSGGSKSGDLEMSDGKTIDVKEIVGGKFKVEDNTYGKSGELEKSRWMSAVNDLKTFCDKKDNVEILLNICKDMDKSDYKLTPGSIGQMVGVTKFFTSRDINKFGVGTANGLIKISKYLESIKKPEEKLAAGAGDHAEFDVGGQKNILSLDSVEQDVKNKLTQPNLPPTSIEINVSSILDKKNVLIFPAIKRLKYFQSTNPEDLNTFTPENIAKELLPMLHLHYTGGIVFKEGNKFWYESDLTKANFAFYGYSKGTNFKKI
jgi:hypothetical protein